MTSVEDGETYYKSFINHQKSGYEITAKMIGYIVERMIQEKIITADKKFFNNFFNINLSISFNCFSVKKIIHQNQYIRNLFKSFENKSKKCGAV